MRFTEKYTSCGIIDEDSGQLFYINFGSCSYKTRDFIVDTLNSMVEDNDTRTKAGYRTDIN